MRFSLQAVRKIRRRDLEDCVDDAMALFLNLTEINGDIFRWKGQGKSKKAAIRNPYVDFTNRNTVRNLLLQGRNKTDFTGEYIEELGFRLSFWNGTEDPDLAANVSFSNGNYSKYVSNVIHLEFPEFGDLSRNDQLAEQLIRICANALDADSTILCRTSAFYDETRQKPFLDRGMFISNRFKINQLLTSIRRSKDTTVIATEKGKVYLKAQG